jgi:GTPase SAR1 family protein
MQYQHINFVETKPTHWATDKAYSSVHNIITTLNARNQGLSDFSITADLQHLTKLDLSKNSLAELVLELDMLELEFLDLSYNKVPLEKVVFKGHFPKLKYLYVYESQLKSIEFAYAMPNLEILTLGKNELTVFNLPQGFDELMSLRLDENKLSDFTINPNDLDKLESLNLQNNPIQDSVMVSFTPDTENCLPAMLEYFDMRDREDIAIDNECKVLLIGNGNVGKSCFLERLVYNRFQSEWNSTHGIAVEQYPIEKYTLNLWDFGGQDIYHATHRLFMNADALYLLFWDNKTETTNYTACEENHKVRQYENHKLPYWLAYTRSLGKGSPCIVIQTKAELHGELDAPNQEKLRKRYSDIIIPRNGFQHIESSQDDWDENGYDDLKKRIQSTVQKIKKDSKIPKNCIALRQALRDTQKERKAEGETQKLMSWDDYLQLAHEHRISDEKAINPKNLLENWLVRTGVVYYREGLMDNQIILDQDWAIKAIYALLDRKKNYYSDLVEKNGKIMGRDLIDIWSPKFEAQEQKLFIDFMLSCELCFEVTPEPKKEEQHKTVELSERIFIIPQLLSDNRPDNQIEDFLEDRESWYVRYEHDFWHYGIMQSFIVRAKDLADERAIWQIGILLKEAKNRALVETKDKSVSVRVTRNSKSLLDKIRNELNEINQDNQSTIQESVSLDGENFVFLSDLKNANRNNETIKATNGNQVNLQDLLFFLNTDEKARFKSEEKAENHRGFHFDEVISPKEPPKKEMEPIQEIKLPKENTTTKKILFLSANPSDSGRLKADNEHRQIKTEMLKGQHRDNFEFLQPEFAVTVDALQRAFTRNPHIVHFSGHGLTEGIVITNDANTAVIIPTSALKRLFKRIKNTAELVLLNSCYSAEQAKAISELGVYVIGNNAPIGDDAAIAFAKGLYTGLSEGKAFEKAFDFAMVNLEIVDAAYANVIEVWKDGEQLDL